MRKPFRPFIIVVVGRLVSGVVQERLTCRSNNQSGGASLGIDRVCTSRGKFPGVGKNDRFILGNQMSDEKTPRSWWSTLPGVLTALGGLLTAVGGLLVILHTLGLFPVPNASQDQTVKTEKKEDKPQTTPVSKAPENRATKSAEVVQAPPKPVSKPPENLVANITEPIQVPPKPQTLNIPDTKINFVERNGYLVSAESGSPLCPTPPGMRTGCYTLEHEYRQNWRNTPDGYYANGKKVKTYSNRSERVFEIVDTKISFYVDDGYLFDHDTATILCPWPKAGVAPCHSIEAKYTEKWRNTPSGFIADGQVFNGDDIRQKVRLGIF